jgi:hypothetical protein
MGIFIIAYNYFDTFQKLSRLLKDQFWILIIAIIATAVGYVFGIGQVFDYQGKYDEEEQIIGLLGSSGLYGPGVIIALLPLILKLKLKKYQKILFPLVSLVLFVFMVLTVRRTVIFIPIVGLIGFMIYTRRKAKMFQLLGLAIAALILGFPLYENVLMKRFEAREKTGRFEEDFYKTEMRYIENKSLMEKIEKFEEPAKIVFGIGNNIFAENISNGRITGRMYHTDIAKLIYSVGLLGILLYTSIYIAIFRRIINIPNNRLYSDLKSSALGLFLISVFVSFNGSVTIITFRSINFLLLGAILGYIRSARRNEKLLHLSQLEANTNDV